MSRSPLLKRVRISPLFTGFPSSPATVRQQRRGERRPSGLVRGAEAIARVAVEVFMKQEGQGVRVLRRVKWSEYLNSFSNTLTPRLRDVVEPEALA